MSGMGSTKVFISSCLIALTLLISVFMIYQNSPLMSDRIKRFGEAIRFSRSSQNDTQPSVGMKNISSQPAADKLLGGLLHAGCDEQSCLSRYQSSLYRKTSTHSPSPYLISRLRSYEDLHKRCGPDTQSYNKTLTALKSGHTNGLAECSYVVWIPSAGLGNRILTMASAFLYALLTNRVLLVDQGEDMASLFCEPFPETSWLLPKDFPIKKQFKQFDKNFPNSYGNMLKRNTTESGSLPCYLYLHLVHDYSDHDKLFFCEKEQMILEKVPWLIMKSDNYYVPSLFLIPSLEQELSKLFPEKEAVFHHLSRYLFHPSNEAWGLIVRFYQSYLSEADEKIGIQIRNLDRGTGPFKYVMDQVLACTLKEKLLPQVMNTLEKVAMNTSKIQRSKAVLMTSLLSGYFDNLRTMYWEHPTVTGEIVKVYQPSHEEQQKSMDQMHNMKAWAEMYLLSLTDVLVTSGWSTFGYVAQGLGGLKPWIMYKPENRIVPDPPCGQAISLEPCFHAPPIYDCKAKIKTDTGALVPHVRHCEDVSWGLKLFDNHHNEL